MKTDRSLFVASPWGRINYQIFGDSGNPTYFAFHGWQDNSSSFSALSLNLPQIQIIAPDLPGHGQSEHYGCIHNYQFIDWVLIAKYFIDQFSPHSPVKLMGHSMGSAIATLFAGSFPERVEQIIQLEGMTPLTSSPSEGPSRLRQYVESTIGTTLAAKGKRNRVYSSLNECAKLRQQAGTMSLKAALDLVSRSTKIVEGGFQFTTDRKLKVLSGLRFTQQQVLSFIDQITCDVLVIMASNGFEFDAETLKLIADNNPQITFVNVDGGHHVHMDEPKVVAQIIQKFMADATKLNEP
jgi:pimeloyl-ACP methyl ester carboxylesterase